MPTTSDYLTQLQTDKQTLATNINQKGVQTTGEETFTELASMVSQIETGGGDISEYFVDDIGASSDIKKLFKKIPEFYFNGNTCESMFKNCTSLEEVDLNEVDTSNANSFNGMFQSCSSLKKVNISGFDTSGAMSGNYANLFNGCSALTEVNVGSSIDMSLAINFSGMFRGCYSLTYLDLSGFGNTYVGNMSYMFYGCSNLETIILSNFNIHDNISSSSNTNSMFYGCSKLSTLDMRSFDFTKITGSALGQMTSYLPSNCLIIVADTTQKAYLNTNASWLTNVKTVDELIV